MYNLLPGSKPSLADLKSLIDEAEAINVSLPNVKSLNDVVKRASDWTNRADALWVSRYSY